MNRFIATSFMVTVVFFALVINCNTEVTSSGTKSGAIDTDFGNDGDLTTDFTDDNDFGMAVSANSDDKIVVAGYSWNGSDYDFALAKYNSDGSLYTGFGVSGKMIADVGAGGHDYARGLVELSDDSVIVTGYTGTGVARDIIIAKYIANGFADTTFNGTGLVTMSFGTADDEAYAIAAQPDGKIVIAGATNNGTDFDIALARYNSNGTLDTSFDGDGKVTTSIATNTEKAYCIAIQTDGKIVVGGITNNGTYNLFAIARYNSDGSLDTSFATNGIIYMQVGSGSSQVNAIAVQSDGKIVAIGTSSNGSDTDVSLLRLNSNGSIDGEFGIGGFVITDISANLDSARGILLQPNGKIVVGGSTAVVCSDEFLLLRYNSNGTLDTTFGTNGIVRYSDGAQSYTGNALTSLSDGKIILAGTSYNIASEHNFTILKYWP